MNHVKPIASRLGGYCLRDAITCRSQILTCARLYTARAKASPSWSYALEQSNACTNTTELHVRNFSQSKATQFRQSFARQKLVAYKPEAAEQGLSFQEGNLSPKEVLAIFGTNPPPAGFANKLLRVLQGRRVDGTLDLPLPKEFEPTLSRYPNAIEDGLQWLRENFLIDEDEAILQRVEREEAVQEKQNPSDLMRRGEQLGLYKPQSGNYQAPLSETEGDVFGVSQLEKRRAENIKKAQQEEEELQQEIDKIQDKVLEKTGQLAIRPDNSLEVSDGVRPPNSFEKWILRSKLNASSKLTLEDVPDQSPWRRLLPSFLFVATVTGLCYLYALTWIPPKRSERMFPNVGLSVATVGGIIASNVLVYMLWKWPPAWRLLNRYFVTVPGMLVPLSLLGNIFSHQTLKHLGVNMLWLFALGLSLHEDVGRGNFLGLYVAGGAFGSLLSTTIYVSRGILFTSHLGASGAVSAIVAGYFILHADDRRLLFVLPKEWQDTFSFTGIQFFAGMLLWEIVQFLRVRKRGLPQTTDLAAHFGGYTIGTLAGLWFRQDQEIEQRRKSKRKLTWIDHLLARKDLVEKT